MFRFRLFPQRNKFRSTLRERVLQRCFREYPLPTTHYPLPTTHYPLPTTHYPLPTTHYPLPTTHYPLPTTCYPLPATCYPLPATRSSTTDCKLDDFGDCR